MADIIKVAKLASKYNFDDIITDHPHTLQLLFRALSYGVIPVTQPQRAEITDLQRKLVEEIQAAGN